MSESQIEQILLNLGLLAADAQAGGGTLSIVLAAPGDERLFDVDRHFAAVILVGGVAAPSPAQGEDREPGVGDGVILSVVRALLHEAHGQIDQVKDDDSAWWFRVCLAPVETGDDPGGVESGVHLLSRRRVVLAGFGDVMDRAARLLEPSGARLERHADVAALMGIAESLGERDLLVLGPTLLKRGATDLLRAVRALCPRLAVAVLGGTARVRRTAAALGMVPVPPEAGDEACLAGLAEACVAARRAAK